MSDEYPDEKLTVRASYDAAGRCYDITVGWRHPIAIDIADVGKLVQELFRPRPPIPEAPPQTPAPSQIRPAVPNTIQAFRPRPASARVPGEAATEIIPTWREENGK